MTNPIPGASNTSLNPSSSRHEPSSSRREAEGSALAGRRAQTAQTPAAPRAAPQITNNRSATALDQRQVTVPPEAPTFTGANSNNPFGPIGLPTDAEKNDPADQIGPLTDEAAESLLDGWSRMTSEEPEPQAGFDDR